MLASLPTGETTGEMIAAALLLLLLFPLLYMFLITREWGGLDELEWKRPPGPAGLPVLGNLPFFLRSRLLYRGLAGLAEEYGPIVWLRMGSKPVVAVQSAELAEEVLRKQDLVFLGRPQQGYAMDQLRYPTEVSLAQYGHSWRSHRKFLTLELLSVRRINQFEEGREQELRCVVAEMRCAWLARSPGAEVVLLNMHTRVRAIIVNSVAQVLLRKRLVSYQGRHGDDDAALDLGDEVAAGAGLTDRLCEEYIEHTLMRFTGDIFPRLRFLDHLLFRSAQRRLKTMFNTLDAVLQELVETRRSYRVAHLHEPPRDLADVVAGLAQDDGTGLPDDELKALLIVIVLGAPVNSSVIAEWALAELVNNPRVLRKLQAELDEVVGRERRVEATDVPQLPYLQAVMKETMRLHPALPMLLPRCTREDAKLGGYHIPAGTKVLVNVWRIHRDPTVWERAEEFWPDRFLPGGSAAHLDTLGLNFNYLPFGSGRRVCPGLNFGTTITHLVVARLLHTFDFTMPVGHKVDLSEIADVASKLKAPFKALVSPRLPEHLY